MLEYMDVMGVVVRAKKPDWAQRAAEKQFKKWKHGDAWLPEFAKALRAHHRKVKRMVITRRKSMQVESCFHWEQGYIDACEDILDKLKEMER